jgi:2-dehydro-3-deoxyphosphooctonate aldolase (KDO 8-P synthase)
VNRFAIGNAEAGGPRLLVIAGPCVVEDADLCLRVAGHLREACAARGLPYVFKASYRKANRSSVRSFEGLPVEEALAILARVKREHDVPILTDVHDEHEIPAAAEVADVLQIPAFLCRQTDLLVAAGSTGRAVNIKKGQFLAPEDMRHAAEKVASTGNADIMLCERGTSFGYHNLIVDMRSLVVMRSLGYPVVMDATHAVQIPSEGAASGGRPEFILPLARAAAAVGIDALFIETHPDPSRALSDAASQLPLSSVVSLLEQVLAVDAAVRRHQP